MDHAPDLDIQLGRAWREHRRYVLDIAFRTLGDIGEAEDVVQEAFTRLIRADLDTIDDVRGWLVVVVGRLCIDRMRLAHRRRETPSDPTDSPLDASVPAAAGVPDPADRVTLDDSVRAALHVVLERLSPAERTAFVLHDVFAFTFDDIGAIVGRSPAACRQLASRARRHIRTDANAPRLAVESADRRHITDVFITACTTGDVEPLLAVLDPEVAGQVDLGGTLGLQPPIVGHVLVARAVMQFLGPDTSTTVLSMPTDRDVGRVGLAAFRGGQLFGTFTLTLRDGLVHHIHGTVDTTKLAG